VSHGRSTCRCPFCGFWHRYEYYGGLPDEPTYDQACRQVALLKELSFNSSELALDELGSHLKRRFRDIYFLPPRRFEELIADIYRQQGFHTRLTKYSRDGGYDVLLVEQSSGVQTIVECKRYAHGRLVRVQHVRQLLGVQLRLGVPLAKLVCTSGFTRPALTLAREINNGASGFQLDLIDAHELLSALEVYNTRLPPLNAHPSFRTIP
jgi:restriction system protein